MEPLFRYGLDFTGINPDNFVSNENHKLSTRRNRAVVPKAGVFFADSLVMIDNHTSRILTRGIDYVFVELNQILSLKTGKDIFGAALVINRSVSSDIKISYSCVGGIHCQSAQTMFDLLEKVPDNSLDFSWYEVDNKPEEFDPTPHFHPIGEASGFEKICHAVDKIHKSLIYTDLPVFRKIISYMMNIFDEIDDKNKYKMDAFFGPELISFKRQLGKAFYNLDKLENLTLATEEDGRIIARPDSISKNFSRSKFIALNALVAFKNVLYNNFVKSTTTGIGESTTRNISPDSQSILDLTSGSVRTFVSKALLDNNDTSLNLSIYPEDADRTYSYVIMKITSNRENRGGVYFLMEKTGKSLYVVTQLNGDPNSKFNHKRLATQEDISKISSVLEDHMSLLGNPHDVTPTQVGLGLVENNTLVSMQEVLSLDPVRKYVTFDIFLLFMKTFTIGKNDTVSEDRNGTINPLEELDIHTCVSSILQEEEAECICETC
jgi:hypothetical protein